MKNNHFDNNSGYDKLKNAFKSSNKYYLSKIELSAEKDIYFSQQYEKNMSRLIKRQRKSYWKYTNTIGKRIAIISVVLLMLFGLPMTIEAVRKPVIGFIINTYDKYSELIFHKSDNQQSLKAIQEVYTLTDLPKEFVKTRSIIGKSQIISIWSDGKTVIKLMQTLLNTVIKFDSEDAIVDSFCIDDIRVEHYNSNKSGKENTFLIWNTNEYTFFIEASKILSIEESINLINYLEKNNKGVKNEN